ncbi:MAG: anti-sigma factor [Croceibacterium sp.]
MTDESLPPEEQEALAAELALGLLEGEERAGALRRQMADTTFAADVARWEQEIARWIEELPAEQPSDDHWRRIERALVTGNDNDAGSVRASSSGAGWKWGTLAASLAAVVFATLWAVREPLDAPAQHGPIVASAGGVILDRSGPPQVTPLAVGDLRVGRADVNQDKLLIQAAYDRRNGVLLLRLGDIGDSTRVPELWLIADSVPRSLGFFMPGAAVKTTLDARDRRALENGAVIAVTLEAPSDKPHDKPAGPVLGKVELSAI